ncbi:hypothetical protein [Nitrospina gracilis]|uniref:hypothetical protein n=1 Tax=Nitrospina gracilis TaxID=35801 RepID=UPI001F43AEFD|nr:hypothetical protein [Nitrospina gracilis]MCF8719138.1 uncharacterized protein YwgA [Nitrospina gracilis Nb-211]
METRLIVLKLFLEELGVGHDIETVDDRKKVQKAVYLGQLSGVDLGYRFSWYLMGPYSPSLTKDYYELAEEMPSLGGKEGDNELLDEVKNKLNSVSSLFEKPSDCPLKPEQWLEILASVHYLLKVSKLSDSEALKIINEEKPALYSQFEKAKNELTKAKLL